MYAVRAFVSLQVRAFLKYRFTLCTQRCLVFLSAAIAYSFRTAGYWPSVNILTNSRMSKARPVGLYFTIYLWIRKVHRYMENAQTCTLKFFTAETNANSKDLLLADPGLNFRGHIPSLPFLSSLPSLLLPSLPLPSPSFLFPSFPLLSLPFSSLSLPSLPLEVGPPRLRLRGLGERFSSPAGPEPSHQTYFGAF